MPGLRFEAAVWKGLSIYGSYGYFAKTGTTPVLAAGGQDHASISSPPAPPGGAPWGKSWTGASTPACFM